MRPHWTGVIACRHFLTFGDTQSPQPLGQQPEEPVQAMRKATLIAVATGLPRGHKSLTCSMNSVPNRSRTRSRCVGQERALPRRWQAAPWQRLPPIRLYHFDFARPDDEARAPGVVTNTFRHFFKAQIPEYLARMGKLPIDGRMEGGTR